MGDSALASKWCKSRCGSLRSGWAGCDRVGSVQMRSGRLTCAAVKADDLSAEGFGPLRWVLRNPDLGRRGAIRFGRLGLGAACQGLVWQGNRCRRQHWGLRLPLLLSLRADLVRMGLDGHVEVSPGPAGTGMARTADGSTEGPPSLLFS